MSTTAPRGQDGAMRDVHRGGVPVGEPRSVLARPLVWLVRLYQVTLSPIFGPVCRYYPSCSAYGVTALERFGPLRGTWLTARRLLRCHPWAAGGVDHVPAGPTGRAHAHDIPCAAGQDPAPTTIPVSSAHRRD